MFSILLNYLPYSTLPLKESRIAPEAQNTRHADSAENQVPPQILSIIRFFPAVLPTSLPQNLF
jgi:hypothetical protein